MRLLRHFVSASRAVGVLMAAGMLAAAAGCGSPPPSVLHLYLARHGQTDWNAERRLQGQTDRPLNETGRAQAERLGERMRGVPLERVYSSTLQRSRETAEIARGKAPLESVQGLREQAIGKFEGLRLGVDSIGTAEFDRRQRDPDDGLDGGESENQFFARVRDTIREIVAQHSHGTILVVGHGGTNQMILRALLDLSPAQADSIRQANDEIYKLDIAPNAPPRLWKSLGPGKLGEL